MTSIDDVRSRCLSWWWFVLWFFWLISRLGFVSWCWWSIRWSLCCTVNLLLGRIWFLHWFRSRLGYLLGCTWLLRHIVNWFLWSLLFLWWRIFRLLGWGVSRLLRWVVYWLGLLRWSVCRSGLLPRWSICWWFRW